MAEVKKDPRAVVEAFVALPDVRQRIRAAGQQIRLDELQAQVDQREAEITNLQVQHGRELDIARVSSGGDTQAKPIGMPFSEALEYYYANAQLKPTTKRTYRIRLNHALVYFGADKDVRYIEQGDVSDYARHVKKTIPNSTTQGHYIGNLATLLNFFYANKGWGAAITTKTLIPKKDTPDSEDRDAFTLEQLSVIFGNAGRFKEKAPCKYWATVAIAFTGCRIEELAQIRLDCDLRHDEKSGVWFIELNGKPDPDGIQRRSLKNKSSWRCVPIHSALCEYGFIDFLQAQLKAGYSRPFESGWKPSIFPDEGTGEDAFKWSHYISNWGGRELAKLRRSGSVDPENELDLAYFHSMRHTFTKALADAGISESGSEAIVGHRYAGSERERYLKLKADAVKASEEVIEPGLGGLVRLLC